MLDNIKDELWKDIPGYEGLYQVSTTGRVWSVRRQKLLSFNITYNGYRRVILTAKNGRKKNERVGRLVGLAWIDNPEKLPQIDHINGDRQDDRASNLRWVSSKENNRNRANNTKVEQYTLNGEYIATYNTIAEANEAIGRKAGNAAIYNCFHKSGYSGGYLWKKI